MGRDKARVRLGGRTLVEHMLERLSGSFGEVILAGRNGRRFGGAKVTEVDDAYPGAGPLAGIHAALGRSRSRWNFCVACDMPFMGKEVAEALGRHVEDFEGVQVVLPKLSNGIEPLAGLYRRDCREAIERTIQRGGRRVVSALADLRIALVEETSITGGAEAFMNVNTEGDLARARARLRGS